MTVMDPPLPLCVARILHDTHAVHTATRIERIERYLAEIGADYNAVVLALFPRARPYPEAFEIVWPRIKFLIP